MRRNRRNLEIEESLLFSYYERPASGRAPARERLRLGPLQSDIMMPQRFGAGFPLAHWRPVYLPLMPGPVTRGLTALAVTAQAGPGGARRGRRPGTPPAWRISPTGPPSGPGGRRPPAQRRRAGGAGDSDLRRSVTRHWQSLGSEWPLSLSRSQPPGPGGGPVVL